MTANDTSRDALDAEVAALIDRHRECYDGDCGVYYGCTCRWDNGTDVHNKGYSEHVAAAVVDAVVMPLVEERDRLRATIAQAPGFYEVVDSANLQVELDAAIKRAEAAEAERDLLEAERDQALAELGRRK